MNVKISNLTLILSKSGPDELLFYIDKPNGTYPFTGNALCKLQIAAGTGEEYVRKHFPSVPYTIVR